MVPVDHPVVGRFVAYRVQKGFGKRWVIGTGSEQTFDVQLLVRQQARPQMTTGCQPQSVAGTTKMVAEGADESDLTGRTFESVSFSRTIH